MTSRSLMAAAGASWRRRLCGAVTALVLAAALAAPAAAQQKPAAEKPRPRIAVLEFERVGVTEAEGSALTDRLRTDLVNLRTFVVLDRAQTEQVLQELAFQQQGVTDPNQAVRIGKLLNVEFIVTGRVSRLPNAYQVNAQMIRVETAEVERSETLLHRGDIVGLLSENMGSMAARLADVEAPESGAMAAAPAAAEPQAAAPPPEPEPAGEATWAAVVGGIALGVGLIMELGAIGDASDAVDDADTARSTGNSALYEEAVTKKSDAEDTEVLALIITGAGAGLLYYYFSQQDDSAMGQTAPQPPPFIVQFNKHEVRAGYAFRW